MTTITPVSVQLYSLRDSIPDDMSGVFNKLAEAGYAGVEPYDGIDHNIAAPILKDLSFEIDSMHASLPLGDKQARIFEQAEAYGVRYIIVPSGPRDDFRSVAGIKAFCDQMNEANQVVKDKGYMLGYHNHWWEFVEVAGRDAYDIFCEMLDPSIILQIDTYWVQTGGRDVVGLIKALSNRAPLLHIKDGSTVQADDMTAVGQGVMDVPAIVQASDGTAEWLIVELDRCATDMMMAVVESYNYLVEKGLGRGR